MAVQAHHFTVDLEEYFHPTALAPHYPMSSWERLERRAPQVVPRILDQLLEHDVQGTFFTLGWLAEREPELVRRIAESGHEIASHGYEHGLVGRLGPDGFRASIRRSKAVLEDLVGREVIGYRAPSFSIVPGLEWAFEVLLEERYQYDASLFPITQHPTYGYPHAEKDPYVIDTPSGQLFEFPSTTARILGRTVPASGGAYFRLLPYGLVRRGLRQAQERGAPGMFYIHPWEMDEWAPSVAAPRLQRWRTFAGRRKVWSRMGRLFAEFAFRPINRTLTAWPAPQS